MARNDRSWFRNGAQALAAVLGQPESLYACPLCLRAFSEEQRAELTREHVPPAAVGGRRLVLTCKSCNRQASGPSGADTHARRESHVHDFAWGTSEIYRPGVIRTGGTSMRVRVHSHGSGMMVIGIPRSNAPMTAEAFNTSLEKLSQKGGAKVSFDLTLDSDQFLPELAAASWLRAAYLAAFAKLGYRYILRSLLEPVRKTISSPSSNEPGRFRILVPDARKDARAIILIRQPSWVRGLGVQLGRNVILLPPFDSDEAFYDRLRANTGAGQPVSVRADRGWDWPRTCEYALDFGS